MQLNNYGSIVDAQLNWLQNRYQYAIIHAKVVMPNHVHVVLEIDSNGVSGLDVKIKSLFELVGEFKTTSSKIIHKSGFLAFKWKRSFQDHIIRNDKSYQNIINYIKDNPNRWSTDIFNSK